MLLVAHRTPPSPERCAELAAAGANVFEVDVRLRGSDLAISHFVPLVPVPERLGARWLRAERLQRDNWRVRWHTRAAADPLLADVDGVIPPGCAVLLDLKEARADRRAALVDRIVATLAPARRYVVGSPHAADLAAARTSGFRTWRTAGTRRELAGILDGAPVDDEALSVRHSLLDAATMRRLGGLGVPVVAWTVNDVARAGALRALGVEGLTTDRLAVLRAASRDAG